MELNSNPGVPRKFPRLPRKFPGLPRRFPGLPRRSTPFSGKPDTLSWLAKTLSELHPWKGLKKGTVAAASVLLGGCSCSTSSSPCLYHKIVSRYPENPHPPNLGGDDSPPKFGGWIFKKHLFYSVFLRVTSGIWGVKSSPPKFGGHGFSWYSGRSSYSVALSRYTATLRSAKISFFFFLRECGNTLYPPHGQNQNHGFSFWFQFPFFCRSPRKKWF